MANTYSLPTLSKIRLKLINLYYWQTCVVRAWDTSRPLLFCPAMNTAMWQHPITAQQVSRLTEFGYVEIPCIAKKLVCGDEGGFNARTNKKLLAILCINFSSIFSKGSQLGHSLISTLNDIGFLKGSNREISRMS